MESDEEAVLRRCVEILEWEGAGHTFAIHAQDEDTVKRFAQEVPASRVLVNTPASLGGVGATTCLFPAGTARDPAADLPAPARPRPRA